MQYFERLKAAREDKDMTQAEVAAAMNTTQPQIYKYEAGLNEMTVGKLRELCLLYGVSSDYILDLPKGLDWPR